MFRNRNVNPGCVLIVSLVVTFFSHASVTLAEITKPAATEVCAAALPIDLDRLIQVRFDAADEKMVFYLEPPTAGILSIEVMGDGSAESDSRLSLLSCDHGFHGTRDHRVTVERSDTRQVLAFSGPGSVFLEVAAHGPGRARETFTLTTRFVGAGVVEALSLVGSSSDLGTVMVEQTDFHALPGNKNEPEEVDPDPNKGRRHEAMLTLLTARLAAPGKNEPEEVDPDPNKRAHHPAASARLVLLPSRPARVTLKNEPEEVDPDPNKSTRFASLAIDGWLTVGEAANDGTRWRRSAVSFRLADATSLAPLREWLVSVLEAEVARSRLIAPGTGDHRLRLLEYEAED